MDGPLLREIAQQIFRVAMGAAGAILVHPRVELMRIRPFDLAVRAHAGCFSGDSSETLHAPCLQRFPYAAIHVADQP